MAKPKKIQKPAFVEIPWTAARAWLLMQGLDRVAEATGIKYQTLRAALGRDTLPMSVCDKLAELSCGKFNAGQFHFHPRIGPYNAPYQIALLTHAETVAQETNKKV